MAKKKNITSDAIVSFYMDYILAHGEQPKNVYLFAKENNFTQGFDEFETLSQLEAQQLTQLAIQDLRDIVNKDRNFFYNTLKLLLPFMIPTLHL